MALRSSRPRVSSRLLAAGSLVALLLFGARARAGDAPPISADDLTRFEAALAQLAGPSPPPVSVVLAQAFADADLGHDAACRQAFAEVAKGPADVRAMAALHGIEVCHVPCWQAFGKVANARNHLGAGADFVAACDEAGKDSLFSGPMLGMRVEMEPAHYALFRQLLAGLRWRCAHDGSARAKTLWSGVERWLPALAAQLVVTEREAHELSGEPPAQPMEKLHEVPKELARRPAWPLLAIVKDEVTLDGQSAGRGDAILKRQGAEGWRVASLSARLDRWHKEPARHAGAVGRVVLRPDCDTRFGLIARLLYTAAQSGLKSVDFTVPLRDHRFRRLRWTGQVEAPLALAIAPGPSRVEWDEQSGAGEEIKPDAPAESDDDPEMTIHVHGFTLSSRTSATTEVPDAAGHLDQAALAKGIAWLRSRHQGWLNVSADEDVPYRRVIESLQIALDSGFSFIDVDATPPDESDATRVAAGAENASARASSGLALSGDLGKGAQLHFGALGAEVEGAPRKGAPLVDAETPTVAGSLDAEVVRRVVQKHLNELRDCYQQELAGSPRLAGHIVIQMAIGGGGAVASAAVQSSSLRDDKLDGCVTTAIRTWEFPMPEDGGAAIVTAPFSLHTVK